jgi:hypothetical protein
MFQGFKFNVHVHCYEYRQGAGAIWLYLFRILSIFGFAAASCFGACSRPMLRLLQRRIGLCGDAT